MNDPEEKLNGRPIIKTQNEFRQNDCSTDDIISAYFEERCDSRLFSEKDVETDRDSSIGVIDVDNVSFFDEQGNEMQHIRLSEQDIEQQNRYSLNVTRKLEPDVVKSEREAEIHRQRVLAHQALMRLEKIIEEEKRKQALKMSEKKESAAALSDISSKLMNVKLPESGEKDWFQPNVSPKTPRCFNDELSSFDGEDENLPPEKGIYINEVMKKKQSLYDKAVNSIPKESTDVPVNSDMKFEAQTEEEQINRLEEDEKKFKLEKSGVLHNSQISQFSGITGGDIQWQVETSCSERENKNLSIGQFFNLRSDRISSLVGSTDVNFEQTSGYQAQAAISSNSQPQLIPASKDSSANERCHLDKRNRKQCLSADDLKQVSDVSPCMRYSSDSRSSSSTLFVQQMLAEMKPGMSGEEINDMLLKSFSRRLEEASKKKVQEKLKASQNRETPKSSKVQNGRDLVRFRKESNFNETCKKTKDLSEQSTILCVDEEGKAEPDSKSSKTSPCVINDKKHKLGTGKGFYSSTPKNQDVKSETDKFRKNCGKVLLSNGNWEPPRTNSFNRIERGRSENSDDNDKTILVDSTVSSELNQRNAVEVPETYTIEDTIVAGDLTVLSQRIEEMKEDNVCIVRSAESEEPVLFSVIQKLALFPKGSLDCSALTPLLQDQFPELLSNFPVPPDDSPAPPKTDIKVQNALLALPGSWVKLPSVWGLRKKILACADVEKTVVIPISNVSKNWLLVSVGSVTLVHSKGKKLSAERKGDAWWIREFVCIYLKETVIPPGSSQSLKVSYRSTVGINFELVLGFGIREVMSGEIQTRSLQLFVNNFNPQKYINVLPNDLINFGVIANQCFDDAMVQVSYGGICELPLMVYIEEDEAVLGNFILKTLTSQGQEKEVSENVYYHLFCEGEKQILNFRVFFQPNVLRDDGNIQDFKASFILKLGCETVSDGILKKIPIKGSVGIAKLLTLPSHSPLVFKAFEKGQSVTRSYPLKNAGPLPIEFSIAIVDENSQFVTGENLFDFPKSFYLPKDEESEINITFNATGSQNFIKRYIQMKIKPNCKIFYEIELIGIIATSDSKPASRTSGASLSTKSTTNSESVPMKLFTTSQALSWTAVALEKEVRQTFQIKSSSTHAMSVRIGLERNLEAFKLVNDNGERVKKLRKVLKPDTPCPLTIIFRPDVVGAHNNSLTFEISHLRFKKKILLSGIGGTPNVLMRNVKSDLNGCKLLRLSHSHASNQFENTIKFTNCGRIPAFVVINNAVNDFSLSHSLTVFPCSFVIVPGSSVDVKISQKLRNDDLQQLLSHREIYKIATLYVISGDEPSRLRIRKLIENGSLQPSERLNLFTGRFHGERRIQLKYFKDPPGFEIEFLKRLIINEVAVVVERNGEVPEPSILEETANEFFSFLSEQTVISRGTLGKQQKPESCTESQKSTSNNVHNTPFSAESQKSPPHKRVTKWLETLECV